MAAQLPPGPRWRRLRSIRGLRKKTLAYLEDLSLEFGDIVYIPLLDKPLVLMKRPEHFVHVLDRHRERYGRGTRIAAFKPVFGEGVLLADGEAWKTQRRQLRPIMSRRVVRDALPVFIERTEALVACLGAKHAPIDIASELDELSLAIAIGTMFQGSEDLQTSEFRSSIAYLNRAMNAEVSGLRLPRWIPTAANRRFNASVASILLFIEEIIAQRQEQRGTYNDLLAVLMRSADERGNLMSDRLLRDQVATLLLTGFETTALALTWCFHLLNNHPNAYKLLQEEADTVNNPESAADLPYTAAVIKEAMRLYPPAWAVTRSALVDDEVDGFLVPAGATIVLSMYLLHRDSYYWDDPLEFRPERFLDDAELEAHRGAYLPFSTGARRCIGEQYATVETAIVLWLFAKNLELTPRTQTVDSRGMLTLRPAGRVLCEFAPRI